MSHKKSTDWMEEHSAEDICKMKHSLIEFIEPHIYDCSQTDTDEAGKIIDMIKDLAAAERYQAQACYYSTVIEAMKEHDDEDWCYRMGYIPDEEFDKYSTDGYFRDPYRMKSSEEWSRHMRDGIRTEENLDPKYGKTFNEYRKAKKYYTENHSLEHKRQMNEDADKHLAESIDTFREIWSDADSDLKARMKKELSTLVSSMVV